MLQPTPNVAAIAFRSVVANLDALNHVPQTTGVEGTVKRRNDANAEATRRLYERFRAGLVDEYLAERDARVAAAPIVEHPMVVADLERKAAAP